MFDYEPFLERDAAGIRDAVVEFRRSHSSEELFAQVARFAVLAFSPSQHSRHALLACLAAHEAREDFGDLWDDLLVECAIYAAGSRQPWSEPPLPDPQKVSSTHPSGIDELRAAAAARDHLRGERWLSARLGDSRLERDLITVAADDFEDFGHKLIVAAAGIRLIPILGEKGRFAILRIVVRELCAYGGERYVERGTVDPSLLDQLVRAAVAANGSTESMHRLFLYDAAMQSGMGDRVADYLTTQMSLEQGTLPNPEPHHPLPREPLFARNSGPARPYALARDYAAWLQSFAVASRLSDRRICDAAWTNLETGPSFEEWSFA